MKIGDIFTKKRAKKTDLLSEESAANIMGIRQPWDSSQVASALNPGKLAALITNASNGETHDYLTLAEEMEERDLHYRSVLATRKHSIEAITPVIEASSDDKKDIEIAEDIRRTILEKPAFDLLIKNALDGLGKGYSVSEIIWETTASKWRPVEYKHRDPRWFEYDRSTGRKLLLRTESGYSELSKFKYVIHEPHLKSGLPIRGGLALAVSYYFLIKSYDLAGWAAFCEVYGYPIRLGKYDGRKGSKKDIEVLKSAVRNLGRDVGAVIPKSMEIEIINGNQKGNVDLFERLANWVDKQVSKAVLGQTMSTDAEGGQYKGDLHNEVRQEIRESDATQLAATLNRDLIKPYIDLNYGIQEHYPLLKIPVPRPENIPGLVESLEKLVPLGFKVGTDQLYSKLGLKRPDEKAELLSVMQPVESPINMNTELNSEKPRKKSELEDLIEENSNDWIAISKPIKDELLKAVNECNSFEELQKRLPELENKLNLKNSAKRIAIATFLARALGDTQFEDFNV